jgi:hypothetical protein
MFADPHPVRDTLSLFAGRPLDDVLMFALLAVPGVESVGEGSTPGTVFLEFGDGRIAQEWPLS